MASKLGKNLYFSFLYIYITTPFLVGSVCIAMVHPPHKVLTYIEYRGVSGVFTVKNAVELLGAFRPDVEKIQYN